MAQHWLKMGSLHLFVHPKQSKGISAKHIFDPFLNDFVPKETFFKAFCDFAVAKMPCIGRTKGSFHLFRHPKWFKIIVWKNTFLTLFRPIFGRKATHFQGD